MKHYCIVHFHPIERYPPVINFLQYIASKKDAGGTVISVLTMHPGEGKKTIDIAGVEIHRLVTWSNVLSRFQRADLYFRFNRLCTSFLFSRKPQSVLYYETLSALGPLLYKSFSKGRSRLLIHHHEYVSKQEYRNGMVLSRWIHAFEKKMYHQAVWISHTNEMRMQFFLNDIGVAKKLHTYILPNYPPANWYQRAKLVKRGADPRIGFVHVGALSMQTMYTKEMALFIAANPDDCYWDVYSDNHDADALAFLKELSAPNIQFKGGVPYDKLPEILPLYDIGVISYNGYIPNHTYAAPNKLFEFLTAGLNVWYPADMKGVQPYDWSDAKPWVKGVDYSQLSLPSKEDALRIINIPPQPYTSEAVYLQLWNSLNGSYDAD